MLIDRTTLADLEVFRDGAGRGGVFALLDETETDAGRRALRQRLEGPPHDAQAIRETQRAVEFLLRRPKGFQLALPGSTELVERYLGSNIHIGEAGPLDRVKLSIRYRDLLRELREGVFATETWLRQIASMARGLLAASPPRYLEIPAQEILEDVDSLPLSSGSRSVAETIQLDRSYRSTGRTRLTSVIESMAEIDALKSMAAATDRLGWVLPEVVESEQFLLEGEGLFHPFVERPVSNPIDLTGGEPLVFLTGPNMAGKTTYLRTAAITLLLAQCGMGVPARRLRFTPVEVLLTSLSPSDNLRAGLSFFQSEVLRVREAAAHLAAGQRSFVLFDEVFKGTNVKDALEASATVILGFAKASGSGFIFSSHLVELVESLREVSRVCFRYFDGRIEDGRARYTYEMQAGVSDQRFGLHLLGEAQIPQLLEQIAQESVPPAF